MPKRPTVSSDLNKFIQARKDRKVDDRFNHIRDRRKKRD